MNYPFEDEMDAFERQERAQPPPPGAVLFVGSSTIRLWPSLDTSFPRVRIINRGFGGSQIEDVLRYAGRIVIPYRPQRILFYAGDNDLASGKTPLRVFEDFRRFVQRVQEPLPQAHLVFISIKPSPCRVGLLPQIREANALIQEYVRHADGLAYADVFTPMLSPDGQPRPELFTEDGLHMNEQGYALWTRLLAPFVEGWTG